MNIFAIHLYIYYCKILHSQYFLDLMEYDLFQLESHIIMEKKDLWVVTKVTKGVETTHFQAAMGLFSGNIR